LLAGPEHGRIIPLGDMRFVAMHRYWHKADVTAALTDVCCSRSCLPQSRLSNRHSAIFASLRALWGRISHLGYP
jgi:hypothetical protein